MTEKGIYSIKPIKLTDIEYLGNLGTDAIQTDYILSKLITQNILYSAYHKPLTISEIAEKLSIEPFIAEEEVNFLERNGFMEKIAAEKYQTNMYIADIPDESSEIMHALYVKFAENICNSYIPLVFKQLKDYDPKRFYTPNNDFNFLMWAMSMFACNKKIENLEAERKLNQHYVIRTDGTENIAFTALEKDFNNSFNKEIYKSYLAVEHEFTAEDLYPIKTWQFNTYYDNRLDGWGRSISIDSAILYSFMINTELNVWGMEELLNDLYRKNILCKNDKTTFVNMVVSAMPINELADYLPSLPEEIIVQKNELDEKIFELVKPYCPERLQESCNLLYQNSLSHKEIKVRVLEQSLSKGILQPTKDNQKHTVNMILFSEKLP